MNRNVTVIRKEGEPARATWVSEATGLSISISGESNYVVALGDKIVRRGMYCGAAEAIASLQPDPSVGEVLYLNVEL